MTQTGDFQCSSCTLSYSGGGSHTYSGTQTCIGCEVAITGAYSFFGNGVGSLVYQSTSMLITASAYFQIALTFAVCPTPCLLSVAGDVWFNAVPHAAGVARLLASHVVSCVVWPRNAWSHVALKGEL